MDVTTGPRTLDELLALLPGVRTMRSISADMLRHLLNRKRRECTWCGNPVGKGRSKWCSDQCVEAFRSRCDSCHQVTLVNARDKGICQLCGRDTGESKRAAIAEWNRVKGNYGASWSQYGEPQNALFAQYGWARGRWFEIDHIVPVIEGGGLLGIDNLRTACGACHAEVTNQLAKRRSKCGCK